MAQPTGVKPRVSAKPFVFTARAPTDGPTSSTVDYFFFFLSWVFHVVAVQVPSSSTYGRLHTGNFFSSLENLKQKKKKKTNFYFLPSLIKNKPK